MQATGNGDPLLTALIQYILNVVFTLPAILFLDTVSTTTPRVNPTLAIVMLQKPFLNRGFHFRISYLLRKPKHSLTGRML